VAGEEPLVVVECLALYDPGVARRRFPEVFALEDDDGLVDVARLDRIAPGVYRVGELALFAHNQLRRSLSPLNSLNTPFLAMFETLDAPLRPRIALDPDLVGLADTNRRVLEHEYWWGPKFNDDLLSIAPGVTRHMASDRERLFQGISRTEFWWKSWDGNHILEVEEVRDRETFGRDHTAFGCRYAHAIVPEKVGLPAHFDGAVRTYNEEQMIERVDVSIKDVRRDKQYRKLWRIDGGIDVATWKRLLSDYFRDNHLVGEYLGAPPEARFGEGAASRKAADAYSMGVGEDWSLEAMPRAITVRASLVIRSRCEIGADREVVPFKTIETENGTTPYVEHQTLNLVKQVRRRGGDIVLPDAVAVISPDDLYYNVAPIWHRRAGDVAETVSAVRDLIVAWGERGVDAMLSIALGVQTGDHDLLIGLKGNAADVGRVLARWGDRVQPRLTDVSAVADALADLLGDWPATSDAHEMLLTPARYGLNEFERIALDPHEFELSVPAGGDGIVAELSIDRNKRPVAATQIELGQVVPKLAWRDTGDRCTRCSGLYRDCPCSVWLDDDCSVQSTARPAFAFLTDRPA
jgi:hypothetical protein